MRICFSICDKKTIHLNWNRSSNYLDLPLKQCSISDNILHCRCYELQTLFYNICLLVIDYLYHYV